jgi:hypothetical protein
MKLITLLCSVTMVLLLALVPPRAHAQTNFEFSYTQCDPTSCQEEGPLATQSSAFVSFTGYCTGGVLPGINATASIKVGVPNACRLPYYPYALIQTSTTGIYNSDACPPYEYYVSYVTTNGEVFNLVGIVVYHADASAGCEAVRLALR